MNQFSIKTLVVSALFTMSNGLIGMMPEIEVYKIYIENHYGAPIKFKIALPQEPAEEKPVANLERVLAGNAYEVTKLSIRTTGAGSTYFSPFTDLAKELQQLRTQAHLDENMYKNAVIIIKPSKSYEGWNIQINWEGKDSIKEMPEAELIIAKIMNGQWGNDCAQKVADISSYKLYDWVQKIAEKPNLNNLLIKYVEGFLIDQDRAKLISTINRLHKELQSYKDLFAVTK